MMPWGILSLSWHGHWHHVVALLTAFSTLVQMSPWIRGKAWTRSRHLEWERCRVERGARRGRSWATGPSLAEFRRGCKAGAAPETMPADGMASTPFDRCSPQLMGMTGIRRQLLLKTAESVED
ncbi:hypothetical protein BD414DRAFT_498101 [Trametes punicea]|nr:hypothetical protein BD414DRAFT_498101 [Trametes punicea]